MLARLDKQTVTLLVKWPYVSVCMWSHLSVHFLQSVVQHGLHILAAIVEVELKSSSPWNDRNQTAIGTLSLKAVQWDELKREEKEQI